MKRFVFLFMLCGCGITQELLPSTPPSFPDHLRTADAFIGMNEQTDRKVLKELMGVDPVRYEWCAAFVNSVLRVNNISGSETVSDNPLMARSFMKWGEPVDEPRMGDIVVFPRGNQGWQGHVGIYVTKHDILGETMYVILGGNQNNEVSYEEYPASSAIAIRRWIE